MSKPGRARRRAQVIVEMLLILPVFLAIVFTIMEMGYIAFQVILLNHATYEVARVGGMTRVGSVSTSVKGDCADLADFMQRIIRTASVRCWKEETVRDQQADQMNWDLVVKGTNRIKLVFPISNLMLAKPPGSGYREISATVRMPIEQPLRY
ncbi:MAG: pilus assembly protein [Elusimicrobia bacterium]|nr:pilus assembly protein [Elusimicrobiota bacterium]